jgi:spore maturation protein CgeB
MLAEFSQEQEDFFTSGKEAFFFKDKQGLIETINFLQQNPEHRKMAKQAAYEKVQQYSLKKHLQSLDL